LIIRVAATRQRSAFTTALRWRVAATRSWAAPLYLRGPLIAFIAGTTAHRLLNDSTSFDG